MTNPPFQRELIENALMNIMDKHPEYDKYQLITLVTNKGFPRPSVRRVKGELLKKWIKHTEILK